MSDMTAEKWNEISEEEKAAFILNGDFKVVKQSGIPADSKVGDCQIVVCYKAIVSGVEVTEWQHSLIDCISQAMETLSGWDNLEPITSR